MSIMVGMGRGAGEGVLIKNAEALELLEKVDTLVIDKTGTLTEGKPQLVSVIAAGDRSENELLRLCASLERASEHALSTTIVAAALGRGLQFTGVSEFNSITGKGILGSVDGHSVAIGNRGLLEQLAVDPGAYAQTAENLRRKGQTVVFVLIDKIPAGLLSVSDPIKESAYEAIQELHKEGIRIVMMTGDSRSTAEVVASQLGIDEIEAEVSPGRKGEVAQGTAISGQDRSDGGRRNQRCACPSPGTCRNRNGNRDGCGDPECRGYSGERGFARGRSCKKTQPAHDAKYPAEPVFRISLQYARIAHCRRRALSGFGIAPESDDCQRRHDLQFCFRYQQCSPAS